MYGTSHVVSADEAKFVFEKGCRQLILGSGQEGNVQLTPQSSTESSKDAGVTPPSSGGSVGQVAEDQVQQSNVELKDNLLESGLMGWLSKALLVAVMAMALLLGFVMYLFIRWRNTGQRTVAVSAAANHVSEKNLDEMIQLPDQTGPGAAILLFDQGDLI